MDFKVKEESQEGQNQVKNEASFASEGDLDELEDRIKKFQKRLKFHHKVIYGLFAFIGAVMAWHGMWTLLAKVNFFNQGWPTLVLGILVLAITGAFFREI